MKETFSELGVFLTPKFVNDGPPRMTGLLGSPNAVKFNSKYTEVKVV